MSNVSDVDDPELFDPEPLARKPRRGQQKETKMAKPESDEEVKEYLVVGHINIKGVSYNPGDKVPLKVAEFEELKAMKVPLEGVEPPTEEEAQAAHDEGVEAQKARIEELTEEEDDDDK